MEALTQIACVSGAGMDTHHHSRWNENGVSLKKEKVGLKKKLKLLKGLSKDLSTFSDLGFASTDQNNDLILQVRGKMITEAAEVLLKQLEQLKAEEKELKRKRKQEKAKLKAEISRESSDSECEEEVMNVKSLARSQSGVCEENKVNGFVVERRLVNDETSCCSDAVTKRIEVCMGNKCKKLGGGALLGEFQRVMGTEEGVVAGCKCMGKCRDGPNVRLYNSDHHTQTPINPLCIGVGLEDVSGIVTDFFAQDTQYLGLNPAC
ncbi:diacylglycerol O-acyltransferase 3 [Pistacia vera]|uniref:diacylglycerol O-acyltransferase 3 n=1 Tax=Pistacia vera TaxID=55513 RepID=UPI0012631190|nr:diacylglycerol O-acyltransferase 3 [Pistacia vera]